MRFRCNQLPLSLVIMSALFLFMSSVIYAQDETDVAFVEADRVKKWINEATSFKILDVRSIAEFMFVGHPEGAQHIPLNFWDPAGKWRPNENFLAELDAHFQKSESIIVVCRSGGRAKRAAKMMETAGFTSVYVFRDGFEGPKDESGLRSVGGWRILGLPSTYSEKAYEHVKVEEMEEMKDPIPLSQ